ncbi:hypothetical protein R6Z07F_019573 [Ovis aries]
MNILDIPGLLRAGRGAESARAPPTARPRKVARSLDRIALRPEERVGPRLELEGRGGGAARPVLAMRPQQAPVSGKVFIQRDYSSGTRCQFQTKFPAELENRIDRQQFEETVRTLNNLYAEAEKLGGQSYLEGCLACLTAYTIFLCMETHYEKVLKKVSKYIQEQNEKIYAPQGLLLTDPIERGLRVIEITIYEDRDRKCPRGARELRSERSGLFGKRLAPSVPRPVALPAASRERPAVAARRFRGPRSLPRPGFLVSENMAEEADLLGQDSDGDSEEVVLTPAELIDRLEQAWMNEKFAPELLENKSEIVECVMEQLEHMEENLKRAKKGDLKVSIHQMEMERIRFVLSSYLRCRLMKIEKFFPHILEKEKTRREEEPSILSPEEFVFAKEFLANTETYLKDTALKHMPPNLQKVDLMRTVPKPDLDAYVFLRVKERQENILVEPESDEQRDYVIDLEEGSQHLIRYRTVAPLVASGAIQLI